MTIINLVTPGTLKPRSDTCGKPQSFTNSITTKFKGNHLIKAVKWNCRSLRSKFPEFEQRSQKIDIIILSETRLEAESVYLKGFDVVRNERASGEVAFL
jgi:hypothetical protein